MYSLMTPLRYCSRGGLQERKIDVELIKVFALISVGEAAGASKMELIQSHNIIIIDSDK